MSPVLLWATATLLAIFAMKIALFLRRDIALKKIMPPGPPGLPLLGNILQLPSSGQHIYFSDIKSTWAADLIDRRSGIYSNRPPFIMTSDILCGGLFVSFASYGPLWRKLRRAAHVGFNVRASKSYQPIQEREASAFVSNLLKSPSHWRDHTERSAMPFIDTFPYLLMHVNSSAASAILAVVYGWPSLDASGDPLVTRIKDFMDRVLTSSFPGAFLVDIFPSMLYIPTWLASWKRRGLKWHQEDTEFFETFLVDAREKMHIGGDQPTFAARMLESEKKGELTLKEVAWITGTMFGTGVNTGAAVLEVFFLAMLLFPDAMRRAQAQIDEVVGRDRMPTFADQENLPYVTAMSKEVLRWNTISALGLHAATEVLLTLLISQFVCSYIALYQDDWYQGYFIPKGASAVSLTAHRADTNIAGTLIMLNLWGMNRDPTHYPDPGKFSPERFLNDEGQLSPPIPDTHGQGHIAFGGGRRLCIGMNLVNQSLFIDIASILWAFNIDKAVAEDGTVIEPSTTFVDDAILM
ncbi:hypothetical protein EW026_g3595 [Hermanssonia centrifuga]|uniref:Cytochrome P450 n=1 Tax=Hermanssonia centrifuga TaxID=98765 RepID=A0A4S4KK67_9APHY|nr:hypothetical protein EW026_g3595 [Hermanssonia centrifuga]